MSPPRPPTLRAPPRATPPAAGGDDPFPLPLSAADRRLSAPMVAFLLSLGWLVAVVALAAVALRRGQTLGDALGLVVIAMAVFVPVVMIWSGVLALRAFQAIKEQAGRIETALDQLRRRRDDAPPQAAVAEAQRQAQAALALFVSRREARQAGGAPAPGQDGLALDPPRPSAAPLTRDELIRALDFPRDDSDAAGFDLLRRALHDHATAELIRAAQEVLSGLSSERIETRDLTPDRARPEVWRAFAQGARGPAVAALGGLRDRSVLALTAGRMRADPAFRDAAHRFLRAFDRRLAEFEEGASDAQIAALSETRAARAFMILGRVTGMFG